MIHVVIRFSRTVSYLHYGGDGKATHYFLTIPQQQPYAVITACDDYKAVIWKRRITGVSDIYGQEKI
jgi:hypothetical protein